ncbi:hypothetical protein FRC09_008821 [Ceratobasidium sp. 395]|nr:hypothetical protein FRC09_008821 [Ceratobasidium sp. 395]
MRTHYPWIILLFVPGGCTGLFQACDVGLQRILKLAIRQAAHRDVVDETLAALADGTAPEAVVNDQGRQTLRNRSVDWLLRGFYAINRPDIVQKAFRLCSVPGTEFNLSYQSLTSRDARQAILRLSSTNPDVYAEIMAGTVSVLQDDPAQAATTDSAAASDWELVDAEEDLNHTVDEVAAFVLSANSASEAAEPITSASDPDCELESEDEFVYMPALTASSVTRSGRNARVSSRYQGPDWMAH